MPATLPPVAACVDIGGTKALLGLVDPAGRILEMEKFGVASEYVPERLADEINKRLRALATRSGLPWERVRGIGYATTGMLDTNSGVIFSSPNQGKWQNVPYGEILANACGTPVIIEMDANAAALGEAWLGSGAGADPFVYLVIGTGIGAGIINKGMVLHGWRGTAGEIGHMIIDPTGPACNCGGHGCLESLASGLAIARRANVLLSQGSSSCIPDLAEGQEITAETVFAAARLGDPLAKEVVDQTAFYLSIALTNLIHLLNPKVIALGGGVGMGGADLLLDPLIQAVAHRVGAWVDMDGTQITTARLGNEAGLLGAAWLVWNVLDKDNKTWPI